MSILKYTNLETCISKQIQLNNYTFNSTNIFRNLNKTTYTNVYIFINTYINVYIYIQHLVDLILYTL